MLKIIRIGFAIFCLALLASGYVASQVAYPDQAEEYARWIDRPAVSLASLIILGIAVCLSLLAETEHGEER